LVAIPIYQYLKKVLVYKEVAREQASRPTGNPEEYLQKVPNPVPHVREQINFNHEKRYTPFVAMCCYSQILNR
jgi:hypothetical protein